MSENREKLLFLLEDLSECYNGTLRSTDISKNVDYVMNVTSSSNMKIDENQWIQMYLVEMKEDEEKKEKIIKIFSKLDDAFPPEYLSKLFKFLWLLRNSSSNLNRSTTHLSSKSKDEINDRPNESNINKSTSLMNIMKKKRISNNNNNNNNNNSNNYLSSSSSMNYDNRYRSMSGLSSTKQSFNLLDNSATYCMRLQRNLLSSSPLYVNKENVKCMEIWSRFIRLSLDVEREELRNVTYNLIDIPSSSYQSSTGRLLPSMRLKQLIQNERNETITKSSEFQNLISSVDLDIYHNCWRKRFQLIPQLTEQIHQFLRNEHHSLYVQALQQFIEEELMKFRSLVASLQRGLLPPHPHLTFIRMRLILVDAIVELRILLKIIKLFPEKNLLTNLYEMMENEINILSKRLIERALLAAMHPLYKMTNEWIRNGQFSDIYKEYFIIFQKLDNDQIKHELLVENIPSFIDHNLARFIKKTGESVHFYRLLTSNHQLVMNENELFNIQQFVDGNLLKEFQIEDLLPKSSYDNKIWRKRMIKNYENETTQLDTTLPNEKRTLHQILKEIYRTMNRQIMNVLINEYDMLNHLKLLKAILLMGQGDFSHCLIELLNDELDKKRISLSLVHLRHRLHTAIALTFDDEDVARQLYSTVDVRLMTTSSDDIGWNVFSLSYRFYDIPLQMMFHEELMMKFRRIFNFLWRLKRSNFILSKHWLLHRSMKSPLERFKEFRVAAYISTIVHSSLTFFLKQVSRYIFMDIIECGWNALFRIIMEKTMDCNEFIDSIHLYLKLVCEKLNIDFHSQWQRKISSELRCIIDLINDYDQLNNRLMELNRSYAKFYQNLEKVKEKERENYDKLKEKIKTATLYRSTSPMVDAHESRSIAKRRSVTDNVGNLSLRKCVSTQNLHLDDSLPITLSQFPSHTTDQFNQSINIPNNNNRNRASTGHRASYGHVRSRYRSSSRARSQMTSSSNTPSLFQLKTMENVNIRVHIAHYISTDYEQEIFHNLQEEKKKFIQEFISLKECFIRLSSSYINHLRSSSSADITLKGLVTTLNFNNFYFNS